MVNFCDNNSRPNRVIIDLGRYGHNLEIAKKLSKSNIIAVVKADAYGHGAKELSKYAYENHNITHFAVATLEEAVVLRETLGTKATIIVLGFININNFKDVIAYNITPTIFDHIFAKSFNNYLKDNNRSFKIALKIDTGMNRLGFDYNLNMNQFNDMYPYLNVNLVMSHLSSPDTDVEFTHLQIERFNEFIKKNDLTIKTSLFSSQALCTYENAYTYTRPGIMTYGYIASEKSLNLQKVMKVFSKVVHIKEVKTGESISYNRTFKAIKPMRVGVVPVGYADGYMRSLSNCGYMFLDGMRCNILGNICMDMTIIDLSEIRKEALFEDVEILGDNITADDIAKKANTIPYEVLCNFSKRIKRYYK